MDATETKLAAWATKRGIDYSAAKRVMLPGDVEAMAAQLRYSREHNAPAEAECVALTLKLWAIRGKQ